MRNPLLLAFFSLILGASTAFADVQGTVDSLAAFRTKRMAKEAPAIPASAYAKAEAGELVSGLEGVAGVSAAKGWGVAVFDIPIESVWKALNDEAVFADRLPVSYSEVVAGRPKRDDRHLFQYMPLPMFDDRWWVTHMRHNGDLYKTSAGKIWELAWTDETDETRLSPQHKAMIKDAQEVDWTHGSWLLIDLGAGKTLVEYFVWSDPGGSLPPGPASRFAGGAVKETLAAMKALAKEHQQGKAHGGGFVRPDQSTLP
jgi:hypothetical protein